jgi:hypothetical protein
MSVSRTESAAVSSSHASSGLRYEVAQTVEQVTAAWELVYRCYLRSGLIDSNQSRIHTLGRVIGPDTVVVCGSIDRLTVSTISAVLDRADGLPADTLFADEIAAVRRTGRYVFELGLFADRRERLFRSVDALLELMRYALYFGITHDSTDAIYCAHPDQAGMLEHLFGFEPISDERPDPRLNDRPTILLRLNWPARIGAAEMPGGLAYFATQPVPAEAFANRFNFNAQSLGSSSIAAFCHTR